jgi:anaerobic selenocysteine-containing dehydrogenase
MAENLLKEDTFPKIQIAFITRTNSLVTEPDSIKWRELWNTIPFKVTLDTRLSETARLSDLILPIATIFEEEDVFATSWSNQIQYAHKVMDPQGECKPEATIFTELAQRLGIGEVFSRTPRQWIEYIVAPLQEHGIMISDLEETPIRAPYIPEIAWEDKKFLTPSGKAELITKDEYQVSRQSPVEKLFEINANAPLVLMTPHPDMALHSQFQIDEGFIAYIHPETAAAHEIHQGDQVIVEGETEGTSDTNLGVNRLILGKMSSLGESTAYYDSFCQIRRWEID